MPVQCLANSYLDFHDMLIDKVLTSFVYCYDMLIDKVKITPAFVILVCLSMWSRQVLFLLS